MQAETNSKRSSPGIADIVAVVIIGRNEGKRLKKSIVSSTADNREVVYVDSGSTDGSVELAKSLGVDVVELDPSTPFTAARGRNAGFRYLREKGMAFSFVQFVDGDDEAVVSRCCEYTDGKSRCGYCCG
jgi:glycosyltransferase involved in cell wall biosynthesis